MQNVLGNGVKACLRAVFLTVAFAAANDAVGATTSASTATLAAAASGLSVVEIVPVGRSQASNSLYDYKYRVSLRNSGAGAHDVEAVLQSHDSKYSVRDGKVEIALLPTNGQAQAKDTITVRAPASFDGRFNSRGQPTTSAGTATVAIESATFSWKITAKRDSAVPTISEVEPTGKVSAGKRKLEISARYKDEGIGIDRASVKFFLDGKDLTSRADIDSKKIEYELESPKNGEHNVKLQVADKLGNKAEREWSFTYGNSAPAVSSTLSLPQLLIVDYQPVSKTQVPASSGQRALYLYSYRVTVRNSGAAAGDVTGKVTSKRSSVAVTDAHVSFGPVGTKQSKASTDTFTIKAGRFFDRRLDKKVTRSGQRDYDTDGDDEDDRGQRGLGKHHGHWAPELIDAWYFLKFSMIFEWKLQARTSNQAPVITATSPNGNVTSDQPTISASYTDDTGIATSKIKLSVNGMDVTGSSTASTTGISYRGSTFAQGNHQVRLFVADTAGNATTASWAFSVDSNAPTITAQLPKDTQGAAPGAVISAQFSDSGTGIDMARLQLTVDGQDVTAQATKAADGISYMPATALAGGNHNVVLRVSDIAGNTTESAWAFGVDAAAAVVSNLQPTSGAELAADAIPTIAATYTEGGAGIDTSKVKLLIDGQDVSSQAQITATGINWRPTAALTEGNHTVKLTVVKRNGVSSDTSWSFVTKTPPAITATAPKDVMLNAGSTVAITAQYGDVGAGVDAAKVTFTLDGVDITAAAQITEASLSFSPTEPLPQGIHVLVLTVTDKADNSTAVSWRFTLDTGLPSISNEQPKNTLLNTGTPTISAQIQDSGDSATATGIDAGKIKLFVNDVDVTAQAQVNASATPGG